MGGESERERVGQREREGGVVGVVVEVERTADPQQLLPQKSDQDPPHPTPPPLLLLGLLHPALVPTGGSRPGSG